MACGLWFLQAAVHGAAMYSISLTAAAALPGRRAIKLVEDERSTGYAGPAGAGAVARRWSEADTAAASDRLTSLRSAAGAAERRAQKRSELERAVIALEVGHGHCTARVSVNLHA